MTIKRDTVTRDFHDFTVGKKSREIARLRAEVSDLTSALAAARAALDGEREVCDRWRAMFVLIPADCADSVPLAEFNGPRQCEHGALGAACVAHDASRAAEAKGGKRPLKISVIEHHGYTEHENNVHAEFARLRKELNDARDERDAARAALDGERELHDETQRALNLGIEFAFDASDGRPGIDTACEVIAKYDALRAAEARGMPLGTIVVKRDGKVVGLLNAFDDEASK